MQSTSRLWMVRPRHFGFDESTASDNVFQRRPGRTLEQLRADAQTEFNTLVEALRKFGTDVTIDEDADGGAPEPVEPSPDAVFPNNIASTHSGSCVLYPMLGEERRRERFRSSMIQQWIDDSMPLIDLASEFEERQLFLEGTGSMVLDRVNRIVYACRSMRTHDEPLARFCSLFAYTPISFSAVVANAPVYHTNVVMAVGTGWAVFAECTVADEVEAQVVIRSLEETGHTVVRLDESQVKHFAGNMLEVCNEDGDKAIVMSDCAYGALSDDQRSTLESFGVLIHVPIPTIESVGGGSARCMIAELFS